MTVSDAFVHARFADGDVRIVGRYRSIQPQGEQPLGEFEYVGSWLRNEHGKAFPLDPDNLPLTAGPVRTRSRGHLPGALADATPDRWGRKLIAARRLPSSPPSNAAEWLLSTGDDRVGCLAFSATSKAPPYDLDVAGVADLEQLAEAFDKIERGEPADALSEQIYKAGRSLGGARPKAVVAHEGELWIAKFQRRDDDFDQCAAEHAAMRLASDCGIQAAATQLLDVGRRRVVLVKRFDRTPGPDFLPSGHYVSALSVLDYDDVSQDGSYPEIAGFLRRHAVAHVMDRAELFRRMVFNVLAGNRDDHLKNHGFLLEPSRGLRLTPAFDVVPQPDMDPMQAIGLGKSGPYPSMDNCVSLCGDFGLSEDDARAVIAQMTEGMRHWREFFQREGADARTIGRLQQAFASILDVDLPTATRRP